MRRGVVFKRSDRMIEQTGGGWKRGVNETRRVRRKLGGGVTR